MTNLNNHSTSNTSEEPELSMEELDAIVPQSEWRKHFPRDFARNAEHYMYGAPREDEEE